MKITDFILIQGQLLFKSNNQHSEQNIELYKSIHSSVESA